jgi:hypothetical protein
LAAATPAKPVKQVFVSHGWGPNEHENLLDRFISDLKEKLRHLPYAPARDYSVELWFDRDKVHARSRTFDDQTVPACQKSQAIILMLSDKFYHSQGCRAEVDCFRDASGAFRHDRAVKIQLSGRRSDGDPEMASGPVQPELFRKDMPNLLALWEKGDAHLRDAFLCAVRDDILAILDQ